MKIDFVLEKETKGAVRYMEVVSNVRATIGSGAKIGSFYVRKDAFVGAPPQRLTITLRDTENGEQD